MNPSIYVAFSGSGFLCPTEVGALLGLESKARRIEAIAGTSGGAIVAALYACHPDAQELAGLVRSLDWLPLMRFGSWLSYPAHAWRMMRQMGWCNPKPLHAFLLEQTAYARFRDLEIDLKVTATDLQAGKLRVFSRDTSPQMLVADAVRASTSIPFVYPPMDIAGRAYVDGGVTLDLPARLLPNDGTEAICIRLHGTRKPNPYPSRIYQVASLTVNALLSGQHALDASSAPWVKMIDVQTGRLDALDASMPVADRNKLIRAGQQAGINAIGYII